MDNVPEMAHNDPTNQLDGTTNDPPADPIAFLERPCDSWGFDKIAAAARPLHQDEPIDRIWLDTRAMAATVQWFTMCRFIDAVHSIQFPWIQKDDSAFGRCSDMWSEIAALGWPLKYRGRLLGIVIRQWAETEPSRIFSARLAKSEEIKAFITYARESGRYIDEGGVGDVEYSIALKLQDSSLPYNPATAKHVYALVNGLPPPLPAPGILVTTLGYLTKPFEDIDSKPKSWRFGPPHEFMIEGVTEWTTRDLLKRAHIVMKQHREFLEAFGPYPLTGSTLSHQLVYDQSLRSLQQGDHISLDYEEEAIRSIDKINLKHINGAHGGITEHLNRVYHRVYIARMRAKLPATPPDGWTERARQEISLILSAPI